MSCRAQLGTASISSQVTHLVLLLGLVHDLHKPAHVLGARQAKGLHQCVINGVVKDRIKGALVGGRHADVVTEYLAHAKDTRGGADGRPKSCRSMSLKDILGITTDSPVSLT